MTRDEETTHIEKANSIARMAHNEALRLAKFEIERYMMDMRVPAGVITGLLGAMDKIMVRSNNKVSGAASPRPT